MKIDPRPMLMSAAIAAGLVGIALISIAACDTEPQPGGSGPSYRVAQAGHRG